MLRAYPPISGCDFVYQVTPQLASPSALDRDKVTQTVKGKIMLKVATYNSRSLRAKLKAKAGKAAGKGNPDKATSLALQFTELGVHVLALQETMSDGTNSSVGDYVCFSSGHQNPNRRCDIWVNTKLPITSEGSKRCISEKDIFALHKDERVIILAIKIATERAVVASVYAPHEESKKQEKEGNAE